MRKILPTVHPGSAKVWWGLVWPSGSPTRCDPLLAASALKARTALSLDGSYSEGGIEQSRTLPQMTFG